MVRVVETVQFVEFSGGDFNDNEDDVHLPNPNADVANAKLNKSLENLLVSKNRRLLEDLTKLRVSWDELTATHAKSEDTIDQLESEIGHVKALNEKLENDLMSLNKEGESRDRDGGPGLAGLDIGKPVRHGQCGTKGEADHQDGRASPAVGPNGDTSILPIVTSQRDRFRQRNAELEEVRPNSSWVDVRADDHQELRKQFESISDLRTEIKSLQSDNLKLYEKVRYTQSYRDTSASGPSGTSGAGMLNGIMRREDDIGRYKDKYEESMNPFEAFKGRVSRLARLSFGSVCADSARRHNALYKRSIPSTAQYSP